MVPRLGTVDAPGSTLVTVTGAVRSPGVLEVEFGTPVIDIVRRAGIERPTVGGAGRGYGGAWLDARRSAHRRIAPGPMAAVGASCGVGVVVALPATAVRRRRDGPGGPLHGRPERRTVWPLRLRPSRPGR